MPSPPTVFPAKAGIHAPHDAIGPSILGVRLSPASSYPSPPRKGGPTASRSCLAPVAIDPPPPARKNGRTLSHRETRHPASPFPSCPRPHPSFRRKPEPTPPASSYPSPPRKRGPTPPSLLPSVISPHPSCHPVSPPSFRPPLVIPSPTRLSGESRNPHLPCESRTRPPASHACV